MENVIKNVAKMNIYLVQHVINVNLRFHIHIKEVKRGVIDIVLLQMFLVVKKVIIQLMVSIIKMVLIFVVVILINVKMDIKKKIQVNIRKGVLKFIYVKKILTQ